MLGEIVKITVPIVTTVIAIAHILVVNTNVTFMTILGVVGIVMSTIAIVMMLKSPHLSDSVYILRYLGYIMIAVTIILDKVSYIAILLVVTCSSALGIGEELALYFRRRQKMKQKEMSNE